MGKRVLAALVGLAVLLPALIWGGMVAVLVIASLALLIAQDEYAGMALPEAKGMGRGILLPGGLAIFLVAALAPDWLIPAVSVGFMLALLVPMFATADVKLAAAQAVRLGFGLIYVPVMLAPLIWIRREEDGLALVFFVLAITWLGDTGAYFAGRFMGKTPLFPRVSPKKTREGLYGGVVFAVAGALGVWWIGGVALPWWSVVALGVVLDLAGVVGDLAESLLKRAFEVKDSGWIMPGHGGILDRIDSLLFSAPLLWVALLIRGQEVLPW